MKLITEVIDEQIAVLIVDSRKLPLSTKIAYEIKKHGASLYHSSKQPQDMRRYEVVFLIDQELNANTLVNRNQKLIYVATSPRPKKSHSVSEYSKIIYLNDTDASSTIVDQVVWFALSKTDERVLDLASGRPKALISHPARQSIQWKDYLTRKYIFFFIVSIFLLIHIAVFPLLGLNSYYLYQAQKKLQDEDIKKMQSYLTKSETTHDVVNVFYQFSRPTFLFFSIAPFTDNVLDVNTRGERVLQSSLSAYQNMRELVSLVLQKDKTQAEEAKLILILEELTRDADILDSQLRLLEQKLPDRPGAAKNIKKQIKTHLDLLEKLKHLVPHLSQILAYNTDKKYLLLFANNMELRPGGGFIGSFGILHMKNLTFESLEILDVYDADGQLKIHVDPPLPIRQYLNQPNFFLRDSAFDPDFSINYTQAKFFLYQELGLDKWAGGFLITTTAMQKILSAFESIYLPDFRETITPDNFYVKAQLFVEDEFFPGSIQKKSFLGSLTRQLLLQLEDVSPLALAGTIKQSLDEKQIVIHFEDDKLQDSISSLYWSGEVINPQCQSGRKDCVIDYLYPFDANLGVNKANFFVTRTLHHRVRIDREGTVRNLLTIRLKNESPNTVFPGGPYKNYMQLQIPKFALLRALTQNGVSIENFDEKIDESKRIGFLIEIQPGELGEIKLEYELPEQIPQGKHVYQLIVQKQVGSKNSDFTLEIQLPTNIKLVNQNFSPLVKDDQILYNVSLDTDKIFLLEFNRT